jgi:hypothetical protein
MEAGEFEECDFELTIPDLKVRGLFVLFFFWY